VYQIETTPEFDKDLKALDQPIATRIINKMEWLSHHPEVLRFPLKNLPEDLKGLHKYQVGDYRVLLWVDHANKTITLYGVEHRRSVYARLHKH
jgi:mRNA interferase RelE/StbE